MNWQRCLYIIWWYMYDEIWMGMVKTRKLTDEPPVPNNKTPGPGNIWSKCIKQYCAVYSWVWSINYIEQSPAAILASVLLCLSLLIDEWSVDITLACQSCSYLFQPLQYSRLQKGPCWMHIMQKTNIQSKPWDGSYSGNTSMLRWLRLVH